MDTEELSDEQVNICFAERFDGYALKQTFEIAWPVYEHTLRVTSRRSTPLNAIEEGMLRLVQAGVYSGEELRCFLGIGHRYCQQLISNLTGESNTFEPLLVMHGDQIRETDKITAALDLCEKVQLEKQDYCAYRDAVFGMALTGSPFESLEPNDFGADPSIWQISPVIEAEIDSNSNWQRPLVDAIETPEVCRTQLSRIGSLRWIRLTLASYMQDNPKAGRILLFDPSDANRPLYDLSTALEKSLISDRPPRLYRDDLTIAIDVHWIDFRENIQRNLDRSELHAQQENLRKTEHQASEIKGGLESVSNLVGTGQPETLEEVLETKRKLEGKIAELQDLLDRKPTVTHLETKDHKTWLRMALETARFSVVIVSPWIKVRVLKLWMPMIKNALDRGCEIWIGHGMPDSIHHKDNSDESALMLLDELAEETGLLHRIPNLGTHEKILICDDEYFVTTSYNWLSFDGESFADRYEHGVVHHGYEVAVLREKLMVRLGRKLN